ncbi:MAG: lipoprotein [Xanthomonadaceae bacterium]|nr:lipoprotein [Xanthomonadaceae bacterium]
MTKRIVFLVLLLCTLTACGNKGPLVLPDKKPAPAPAAAASPHPATAQPGTPASQE